MTVWGKVAEHFEQRRTFATPGDLARFCVPSTVQTPALEFIDKRLVALSDTPDDRLVLSMPPQEGKSDRCSMWFPLWLLTRNPYLRIGIASYGADIARRWGRRIRDAIKTHPELGLTLKRDVTSAAEWHLSNGIGGVFTVGVGGAMTGRPVDVLIMDDLIKNREDADSAVMRENAWNFWVSTAQTRLAPGAPVLLVMTRWHEDDIAGRLLNPDPELGGGGHVWEYLNIPAQAQGDDDPLGRRDGEWLVSTRGRSTADWEARKAGNPARDWEAMYQGAPSLAEGNLFPMKDWQYWEGVPPTDYSTQYIMSWDLAFKDKQSSDYVVGQFWVCTGANAYLVDQVRGRWSFTKTLEEFRAFVQKWPMATVKLVEDKANGTALIDSLRREIPGIIPVEPKGGKYSRASAVSPFHAAGNIYLPRGEEWVKDLKTEAGQFPTGAHDDQVDAMSQALTYLLLPAQGVASRLYNLG